MKVFRRAHVRCYLRKHFQRAFDLNKNFNAFKRKSTSSRSTSWRSKAFLAGKVFDFPRCYDYPKLARSCVTCVQKKYKKLLFLPTYMGRGPFKSSPIYAKVTYPKRIIHQGQNLSLSVCPKAFLGLTRNLGILTSQGKFWIFSFYDGLKSDSFICMR